MEYEDLIPIWNMKVNSRIKHKGEKLQCMLCSYFHGFSSEIKRHMKNKLSPKIVATCSMCDWEGAKQRLKFHKKSSHGEGHKCENCEKIFTRLNHLTEHNDAVHLGIKFPCDKCDYKATRSDALRTHERSIHEGKKVPCTQCEHKAYRSM